MTTDDKQKQNIRLHTHALKLQHVQHLIPSHASQSSPSCRSADEEYHRF